MRRALESAVREQLDSPSGVRGLGVFGGTASPAVGAAVRSALEGIVKEAMESPSVRMRVESSITDQLTGLGYGMTVPAVRDAVATQLQDVVKDVLEAPGTRMTVEKAVDQELNGFGFGVGLTTPAIRAAVGRQLEESVRDAMRQPSTRATLVRALDSQLLGVVPGFTAPALSQAVARVLDEAVKDAVLTSDAQESIARAVRQQTARLGEAAQDPALAVMLRQQGIATVEDRRVESEPKPDVVATEGKYSNEFRGPDSFFSAHEVVIDSFESLTAEISALASKSPGMRFVWRGHQDAAWGLHSSLYRRLMIERGIKLPGEAGSRERQTFPDEDAMVRAEDAILAEAAEWRMSDQPGLELFARLQHQGGPSRLLDVTRSPFVAAWFAVEANPKTIDHDARLFALATTPPGGDSSSPGEPVLNEAMTGGRYPFWFLQDSSDRREADWGTGALRRVWVPPVYDPRIASQNAAFLLEGVPMFTKETLRLFKKPDRKRWGTADIAASMSIYARPVHPRKPLRPVKSNVAPLFTFRIKAAAKADIRSLLESAYGMTTATVYPDVQGLSKRLCSDFGWLAGMFPDPIEGKPT